MHGVKTSRKDMILGLFAAVLVIAAVFQLERVRAGVEIAAFDVGRTPATLYQRVEGAGPIVVVAHGFAGSRQIMQAYTLALAQSGYRVVAFDFQGHGRNPVPMSGDVTSVEGTTALLVTETREVIAAARGLPDAGEIAVLGHSMATDILVRASIAEAQASRPLSAVVAISMFSQAVTAQAPQRLLVISGQWEGFLRGAALDAVHLVDPAAGEGDLAQAGDVTRRAVVAPMVEHVGVLFSPTAVDAAKDWLDQTYGRQSAGPGAGHMGLWVLALLLGVVVGFRPLVRLLPRAEAMPLIPARRFVIATLLPAVLAPLLIPPVYANFLPVLVADYIMLHLALFGLLQLTLLGAWGQVFRPRALPSVLALGIWGIVIFGLALDRYAASFWPSAARVPLIAVLALGTIPFMVADSLVTQAGRGALWRRVFARVALFASLVLAAVVDPEQLTFVVIVLPVFVLFYLVHGVMGRWVARRSGGVAAGLGLGLCLAWALGVSFPLFS